MLRLAGLVAALVLACVSTPLVASAQGAPSLNWGSQVNPSRYPTDAGYRYLEINVARKVDDDEALYSAIDPGSGAWATRDFNQHIQVWQVGVVGPPPSGAERFTRPRLAGPQLPPRRGSRASRSPSPSRLKPSTDSMMAAPGNRNAHQAPLVKYL